VITYAPNKKKKLNHVYKGAVKIGTIFTMKTGFVFVPRNKNEWPAETSLDKVKGKISAKYGMSDKAEKPLMTFK
tara:strand:- start:4410 stop:4631 length:222 start_codon:yes stop_codon:yes gene_type:complete